MSTAMNANDAANFGFEVKASSVQRCPKMFAKGESKLLPALQGVGGPGQERCDATGCGGHSCHNRHSPMSYGEVAELCINSIVCVNCEKHDYVE